MLTYGVAGSFDLLIEVSDDDCRTNINIKNIIKINSLYLKAIVVSGFHFLVWLEKKPVIDLFGLFLYI